MPVWETDPLPDWQSGDVSSAMMNTLVRNPIAELRRVASRGIVYRATSTQNTESLDSTWVDIDNLKGTIVTDSPRTLQAVLQGTINALGNSQVVSFRCYINGETSINGQEYMALSGGPGQTIPNCTGIAIAVPAGTIEVNAQMRLQLGGSGARFLTGTTMQIIDVGAG